MVGSDRKTNRAAPAGNLRETHRRLLRYMTRYRGLLYGLLGVLLLCLLCELCIPLIIESAINSICSTRGLRVDFRSLAVSLGVLGLVVLLSALAGCLQEILCAKISLNMALQMRKDAFSSMMDMSVAGFSSLKHGDLMSRIVNDTELAAGVYTECFKELISACVILVGCAAIMFVKCAGLAAVTIGTALVSTFAMGVLGKLVFPAYMRRQTALGELTTHVEESLKAFRTCTTAGRTDENIRRMELYSRRHYRNSVRSRFLEYLTEPVMLLFGNIIFLLTVIIGVKSIAAGTLTIGALQAFILYSRQFVEPLNAVGEFYVRAQAAMAGAERVFQIIEKKSEKEELAALAAHAGSPSGEGETVELEDVGFAYHRNRPVLKGVDLNLRKGERLALVGRTGEGKTTITELLMLFYPAYSGSIRVDGTEIRGCEPAELRDMISVVPQRPQLVKGSVYDNLVYGCRDVQTGDVDRIVRELSLDRLLARLPKGLDTELSDTDDMLSQGELQLICLGRALLRSASILILDEATSSLDPSTEEIVRSRIERAMQGRTCIVIAHRLASVKTADHIAVLSEGRIAEYGTHESLMAMGGTYYQLYQTQFSGEET